MNHTTHKTMRAIRITRHKIQSVQAQIHRTNLEL